jgi:CheY-like chemotaxis protein
MEPKVFRPAAPVLLLAEDDSDWTYLFSHEFQILAPHWEIKCAHDGREAVDEFHNTSLPQALVTDLNMPRMDGIELIEWIKGQPQLRQLPILVFSSSNAPAQRQRCAALGVSIFLEKGASLRELRSDIRSIVKLCEDSHSYSQDWKKVA